MPERTENIMNDFYGLEKLIEDNGGIENFRCFTQMGKIEIVTPFGLCMVSGDKETWTECKIDESRYKVSDGYKITLRSIDPMFTYNHYYQSDFMSLMKSGWIIVKTSDKQTIQHIKWLEHLCGKAYVVHEADIVTEGEVEK